MPVTPMPDDESLSQEAFNQPQLVIEEEEEEEELGPNDAPSPSESAVSPTSATKPAPASPAPKGRREFTEEEKKEYGARVQRRIDRSTAKQRAAEEEAALWRQRYEQLAEQHAATAKQQVDTVKEAYGAQRDALIDKMIAAQEEGNADEYREAMRSLAETQGRMLRAELQQPLPMQPSEDLSPNRSPSPQTPYIPEAAQAWAESLDWYGRDRNKTLTAQQLFNGMIGEGYDPDAESFYTELNHRIGERFPDSRAPSAQPAPGSETPEPEPPASEPPAASAPSRDEGIPVRKRQRRLSQEDLTTMAKYGLDPSRKEHRIAWLNRDSRL